MEALTILEQEKDISKETMLDAIENSLMNACKNHFKKADNIKVVMNRETCDFAVYAEKTVVEEVEDPEEEISLVNAKMMDSKYELGDIVQVPIDSKSFGRIATQNAKRPDPPEDPGRRTQGSFMISTLRRKKDIVTGIVQRYVGRNISIDLGKGRRHADRKRAGQRGSIQADRAVSNFTW